ncbi:MAG: hypothetical protein JXR59_10235 [Desulfuromonadaceae bacterium]|nr:hypothetical protein [Desulfuromonadaceae bacterium]
MSDKIVVALQNHNALLERSLAHEAGTLEDIAQRIVETFNGGGRLFIAAGGSLGWLAEVLATCLLHRLEVERPALPVQALSLSRELATALCQAGQFDQFYTGQLQSLVRGGDCLLLLDEAADLPLLAALPVAKELDCPVAVLSVAEREAWLEAEADLVVSLDASTRTRGREVLLVYVHLLCELIEAELFGF